MRTKCLVVTFLAALSASAQSLLAARINPPEIAGFPTQISFYCSQAYDRPACTKDVQTLRARLAHYPVDRLGSWIFVLVPSGEWKRLVTILGGDAISPAFTIIDRRTTVLEQALFSGSAARDSELLRKYGAMKEGISELALTHELGHGICNEPDERRADDYGRLLRNAQELTCEGPKVNRAKR